MKKKVKKIALVSAGLVSLALGVAGIVLPLLPTTPFLLLSAACFARSSDRHFQWLINHKWFGRVIRDYRIHKSIPLGNKIFAISVLWATILYSAFFVAPMLWLRVLLITIAIAVSVHILHFKTRKKDEDLTDGHS
jgi:hypothetical protein